MRKLEISAYTIDEAKVKAFEQGITVIEDATLSWRRAGKPMLKKQLDIFIARFLEGRKMFAFEGAGAIIMLHQGKYKYRRGTHTFVNYPKKAARKMKRCVEIRNLETDELLGISNNKNNARKLASQIVRGEQFSVYGVSKYTPVDKKHDFDLVYNPGVNAQLGQFLVFGVDDGDVRLLKQRMRDFN